SPSSRTWCAPGAVLIAGLPFGLTIFGRTAAFAGLTRVPGGGSSASVALDRMMIQPLPLVFGKRKLPTKLAPAASVITSPGCAASSAAWRSAPAATAMVRPVDAGMLVSMKTLGCSGVADDHASEG